MASTVRAAQAKIAARCRRVGWDVEMGTGRQAWNYRITLPDHTTIDLHKTPSDGGNWEEHVLRKLNKAGLATAEVEYLAEQEASKQAKLAADRAKAKAKEERLAQRSAAVTKASGKYAGPELVDINWLLAPAQFPETRTVLVSPEIARKVLDTVNTHNRRLKENRVEEWLQAISDDEWAATHQGGAIDWDGTLQDGQHRLEAIYRSGKTMPMMWSVGMDPKNFKKIDTGAVRSARDTAYVRGEADPARSSAAAKMLVVFDLFGPDAHVRHKSYRVSNDKVDRTIEAMGEDLRRAIFDAKLIKRELKRVNPTAMAVAIYLIRKRLPNGDPRVARFIEDLTYGEGISKRDPVWHLRRMILNADGAINAWVNLAYILKAWNHYAKGNRNMQQLVWRSANEPFPANIFLPPPLTDDERAQLLDDERAQLLDHERAQLVDESSLAA